MALIYADDFQQLANSNIQADSQGAPPTSTSLVQAQQIVTGIEAIGFYRPAVTTNVFSNGTRVYASVSYYNTLKCLSFRTLRVGGQNTDFIDTGYNGLKRDITVKGDTLFFSMRWLSNVDAFRTTEPFLKFNDMYTVSFGTGTLIVNGVDTGFSVNYGVDANVIIEVILGPDYMEVWIGDTRVTRIARSAIPITQFSLGYDKLTPLNPATPGTFVRVFSLIIADNSPGSLNSRIGRKQVISIPAETVSTTATLETFGGVTAVSALKQPVQDLAANTGALVGGNLFSSVPFTKTTLTATLPTGKILASCIHVQAKKRNPTNDGVVVVPWINAGGTEYLASNRPEIRSRWKGWCTPIEVPDISATTLTFGYVHDYPAGGTVFVDDRTKVEVYGEPAVSLPALPYQSKVPTNTNVPVQTAAYSAYVFDYAKSNLGITKANVNNLTYLQEQ